MCTKILMSARGGMRGRYETRPKGRLKWRRPWETSVLSTSLFFLFVFPILARHRDGAGERKTTHIDCHCLPIVTQWQVHIQRCRDRWRGCRIWLKKEKETSLPLGRVAAIFSSTDGLWRLRGRLNHYYPHSITFSSCCLLFRAKKCLMTHCAIVTQTIRANDVRAVLYINCTKGQQGCGRAVLKVVLTVKNRVITRIEAVRSRREAKWRGHVVWDGGIKTTKSPRSVFNTRSKSKARVFFLGWKGHLNEIKQDQTNVRDVGWEPKTSFTQADTDTPERRISAPRRLMCKSGSCKTSVMHYRRFQVMQWKQTELSLISH